VIRLLASSLAAALASLPFVSPLAVDPELPRHDRPGGISLARRKDTTPAGGEAALVPTLGTLFNLHTDEAVPLGDAEPTPERFSDLLADKALCARRDIAPALLDLLRALARAHPGVRIDLVSGYRSEKRNEMMRKKGRHVASHSQHSLGQAVDFRVEGLGVGDVVEELGAMRWRGGIGRYDAESDRFVHVDVGPNRRWKGQ
jgi:hypothetical protein